MDLLPSRGAARKNATKKHFNFRCSDGLMGGVAVCMVLIAFLCLWSYVYTKYIQYANAHAAKMIPTSTTTTTTTTTRTTTTSTTELPESTEI